MTRRGTKRKEAALSLSSHHDSDLATATPNVVSEDPTHNNPEENIVHDGSALRDAEQWDPARMGGNDKHGCNDDCVDNDDMTSSQENVDTASREPESHKPLPQGATETGVPQIPLFHLSEPSSSTTDQQQQYHLLEFWDWMNRWNIYQHSLAHYWRERYNDPFVRKYHELVMYKQLYGDCNVPASYVADDETLGSWVKRMRVEWREGRLDGGKVEQLRSLGFEFERGEEEA
ncbi:hypothetical protein HJC23_000590 [Cyclotella cryptica]|uniref:Helicase-associated domain-containing protein n=1 Tax=Cyclotella cryptica TaxID=29204 RepID=A0ABD3PF59_9STRA|eukprot:CCRYP_015270-RA/>CCRYP_015270-RA protein AED:0.20 eAED:0.20 QI:0/-1/0/1/-1/1/1/0/230